MSAQIKSNGRFKLDHDRILKLWAETSLTVKDISIRLRISASSITRIITKARKEGDIRAAREYK